MLVTINPCFHWIGYHITTGLLQEGVEVVGIDPISDGKSDFLYMFVGRNSNFQHFFQKEDRENHVQQKKGEIEIEFYEGSLMIKREAIKEWVELPKLYGEWMNTQRWDIKSQEELVEWIYKNEAFYVGDLFTDLWTCLSNEESFTLKKYESDEALIKERVEAIWGCEQLLDQ